MKYALCVKLCQHDFTIVMVHKLPVHGHCSESGLHSLPFRSSRCPRLVSCSKVLVSEPGPIVALFLFLIIFGLKPESLTDILGDQAKIIYPTHPRNNPWNLFILAKAMLRMDGNQILIITQVYSQKSPIPNIFWLNCRPKEKGIKNQIKFYETNYIKFYETNYTIFFSGWYCAPMIWIKEEFGGTNICRKTSQ